jgi:hypothetical protein
MVTAATVDINIKTFLTKLKNHFDMNISDLANSYEVLLSL